MAKNEKFVIHSIGNAFVDDVDLFDILDVAVSIELQAIEAQLNSGRHIIPTEQFIGARCVVGSWNMNLIAKLTGGTITTGASVNRVNETLTKVTNALTLSQTPEDTQHLRIVPVGSSKEPLTKVSSAPSVGEYSISSTTVTLNASQTETQFVCTYFYADASYGETLTIDPDDLPSSFELLACAPAKDLFPDLDGNFIIEFAKCEILPGTVEISTGKGEARTLEFSVNVRNDTSGDVKMYISKTV